MCDPADEDKVGGPGVVPRAAAVPEDLARSPAPEAPHGHHGDGLVLFQSLLYSFR